MPPKSAPAGLLCRTARKSVTNVYPTPGCSPPSSSSPTNIATAVSSSSPTGIATIPEPSRKTSAVFYSPIVGPLPTINVSPIETTEVAGTDWSLVKSDVKVDANKEQVNSIAPELANFPVQTRIPKDGGSVEHLPGGGGEGSRKVKRKVIRKTVRVVKKVIKRVPKRILINGPGNQGEVERAGNCVNLTEATESNLADDVIRKSSLLDKKTEKIRSIGGDNYVELNPNPAYHVIENCHTVTETANSSKLVDDVKGTLVEFAEEGNDPSGTDFVEVKITEINVKPHAMEHMVIANGSNYTKSNDFVSEVANELTSSADVEQVYCAHKCTTGNVLAEEIGDSAVEDETDDSVMKTKNVHISSKEDMGPVEMNNIVLSEDSNGCLVKNENSNHEVENHNIGSNEEQFLSGEMGALERKRRRRTEIFVGGLSKDTKEGDIRKVFEEVGAIIGVSLMPSNAKTGSFGFVRFAAATDAKNALARYSTVEICGTKCYTKPVDGNDTIFIRNINRKWKTEDVVYLLEKDGIEKVDKVIVKADPSDGQRNRGFAFVEFETSCYAKRAFSKLQKNTLFGNKQKIRVEWARPLIEPDEDELLKAKSVYVEHLTSSWDERKVNECFEKFGEIENIVLAKDLPLSKRTDFAFINYTTRDAALACIESFSKQTSLDNGSQVKIVVSLAKPTCMSKQSKQASGSTTKQKSKETPEVSKGYLNTKQHYKEKPEVSKATKERHEPTNHRPASVKYNHTKLDTDYSTTEELVQLLRQQASTNHIPQHPIPDDHFPIIGGKRQIYQGYDPLYVEPRGLPRARVESSYPMSGLSAISHSVRMTSFPYHQEGPSLTSETLHRGYTYPSGVQMRDPAPYYGSNNMYHRY